jgi:dipeptidyl aminopeptidase/acylaminoacyl peptidase
VPRRSLPFIALLLPILCFAQQKRPITFEDMIALRRISDSVISPDDRWVMFSAVDVNLDANTRTSHLWLAPISGDAAAKAITSGAGESRGRFSPDGKRILFLSTRDGGSQIWLQDFDAANGALSGEPKRLTSLSGEADGPTWSPDGKNIVFISEVYSDCPLNDDACNKKRDDETAQSKVKAKLFTGLYFRHWNHYTNFKRRHLLVVAADSGAVHDVTPGDYDSPPFTVGGQDDYSFSPDGQQIAFTSNHAPVAAISTNNDVFVVPVSGGEARKISTSPGSDSTPLYSPDGRYIAFRTQQRDGFESDRFRLALYDRKAQTIKVVTEDFDRWVGTIAWAPDSKHIFFNAEDKGEAPFYRVSVDGGGVKEVLRGTDDEPAFSPDGKTLVFTRQSIEHPNEVFSVSLKDSSADGAPRQVSHLNDAVFARVFTVPLEPFWFVGGNKTRVQGWLVKPPDFDAHKKYPVKFLIHGGPQSAWGDSWTFRWNAELFAAKGYLVVMINPRGSVGYGQKFTDEISGDWGGLPYVDLMRGLDYVLATYPFADGSHVCAMGASYGGYMVNWIITHTDRFQCAVSHDGMFNSVSSWGSTEELFFNEWEFKGTPWTDPAMYAKWSPSNFVKNIKTPTLVVHSQLDYRLDVSEGFQLFTTLQRLKVPSKMLYFRDEGHWVLKPQNSRLWYQTVNGWVDQWLKRQ